MTPLIMWSDKINKKKHNKEKKRKMFYNLLKISVINDTCHVLITVTSYVVLLD